MPSGIITLACWKQDLILRGWGEGVDAAGWLSGIVKLIFRRQGPFLITPNLEVLR